MRIFPASYTFAGYGASWRHPCAPSVAVSRFDFPPKQAPHVRFSADHVSLTPNGQHWRGVIGTSAHEPHATNGQQARNVSLGEPGADVGPRRARGQFMALSGPSQAKRRYIRAVGNRACQIRLFEPWGLNTNLPENPSTHFELTPTDELFCNTSRFFAGLDGSN